MFKNRLSYLCWGFPCMMFVWKTGVYLCWFIMCVSVCISLSFKCMFVVMLFLLSGCCSLIWVTHVVPGKERLQKHIVSFLNVSQHTHLRVHVTADTLNSTAKILCTKNKWLWVINYELSWDEDNPTKLTIRLKALVSCLHRQHFTAPSQHDGCSKRKAEFLPRTAERSSFSQI